MRSTEDDRPAVRAAARRAEQTEKPATRATKRGRETEPLIDGKVDLGALATEFLILGLDPYPRKPGRDLPAAGGRQSRTKARSRLWALKKGRDGRLIAVVSGRRTAILPPRSRPLCSDLEHDSETLGTTALRKGSCASRKIGTAIRACADWIKV